VCISIQAHLAASLAKGLGPLSPAYARAAALTQHSFKEISYLGAGLAHITGIVVHCTVWNMWRYNSLSAACLAAKRLTWRGWGFVASRTSASI
jgi:hypothetical protein